MFPKSLQSGVIYKYTCATCNRCYIGSSKRFWEKRLEEHIHLSALTGKRLNGLQVYAPLQHVKLTDDCEEESISRDDFKIISRHDNEYILRLKESLYISIEKPLLNNNLTSVPLTLF